MSQHIVIVSGLSPETSKDALLDFLGVCGRIVESTDIAEGSCEVRFEDGAGVETATLVSGAIVVDSPITIVSKAPPEEQSRDVEGSASTAELMISEGRIKGEEIINVIRGRIEELKAENGLVAVASESLLKAKDSVVQKLKGPKVRGEATSEQHYCGNQPQWGPAPVE